MILSDDWTLVTALPYLAAAGAIACASVMAFGARALRLYRRQKQREMDARRRASGETPWGQWLREINERDARIRIDDR